MSAPGSLSLTNSLVKAHKEGLKAMSGGLGNPNRLED